MRNQREEAQLRHIARISERYGEDAEAVLRRLYLDQRFSTPAITAELGITFRMFRSLCQRYGIPMRSISAAVAETWVNADDRRAQTSRMFNEINARRDMTGEANPARDPEARRKISAAKRADNAAKRPEVRAKMSATMKRRIAAGEIEHLNIRMARSHRRSRIERIMQDALADAGVVAEHGHRIGSRYPDLVVPEARLVIECDGLRWHPDGPDPVRDQELREAGWQVLHFTDERIVPDAAGCAAEVVAWLKARGFHPSSAREDRVLRRHD